MFVVNNMVRIVLFFYEKGFRTDLPEAFFETIYRGYGKEFM